MAPPTKAYLASLRKATKSDYTLLLRHCVEAWLEGHEELILATSYRLKFPKDFPKGLITSRQPPVIYRRIKVNRLVNWLNQNGHTAVTMEDLRVEQRKVTIMEKELLDDGFLH